MVHTKMKVASMLTGMCVRSTEFREEHNCGYRNTSASCDFSIPILPSTRTTAIDFSCCVCLKVYPLLNTNLYRQMRRWAFGCISCSSDRRCKKLLELLSVMDARLGTPLQKKCLEATINATYATFSIWMLNPWKSLSGWFVHSLK